MSGWWSRRREHQVPADAVRAVCTTCGRRAFLDEELGGVWVHVRYRDNWHMVQLPLPPDPTYG